MRKYLIQLCLIFFIFIGLSHPHTFFEGASNGLLLWSSNIVPTLLPFLLLTNLLLSFSHLPLGFLYPFFFGFLCGCPLGAKIINDFVSLGIYTKKEGQSLLAICNNISPMFCIGYSITLMLHQRVSTLCFFFCLYLPNVLYLLYTMIMKKEHILQPHKPIKTQTNKNTSLEIIMLQSLQTIFMIGLYIMIFSILSSFAHSIPYFSSIRNVLLSSLEITTGILHIVNLNCTIETKTALVLALSSFGGFCGIAQTKSVISNSGLSLKTYTITKLLFALISFSAYTCIAQLLTYF